MRYIFLLLISFRCVAQPVTLTAKNMSITVDVKAGARIISLKIDDHEILGSPAVGDKQLIAYIHHFINAHPQAQ